MGSRLNRMYESVTLAIRKARGWPASKHPKAADMALQRNLQTDRRSLPPEVQALADLYRQ